MGQMFPAMQIMQKWSMLTTRDFAERLKNPYLHNVFATMPAWPMAMLLMVLTLQHNKSAGYVIGGALALVRPIESRYRQLGGEIKFKSRVTKIIVENDKAVAYACDV